MTNIINTQGLRYINLDLLECANCFQISNRSLSKKVGNGEYLKNNSLKSGPSTTKMPANDFCTGGSSISTVSIKK